MSASAPKDVSVVVLNWNTKNLLEKFIPYIQQTEYEGMEIVVADNASTDGSVNLLKDSFPQVRVIELAKNLGYAGGYNEALKQIHTPFAVLLNSDVEVHPNWLSPMMSMMKQDDSIGAIQPKILDIANRNRFEYAGACGGYMDKFGYAFCRGRLFNNCEEDEGQYDERRPIFWASGAALLVRMDAYWKAGGLDTDFFAHMEEIDLCWRMQNLGFSSWVCPESKVWHVGGGTLDAYHAKKTFLNFRNNLVLLLKNLPARQLFPKLFIRMVLDAPGALKLLIDRGFPHFFAVVKAHWSFLLNIRKWYRKRLKGPKKSFEELDGSYSKSIVLQHFLKGKKEFSELD
jgi:GT2 family glycosyltransferase